MHMLMCDVHMWLPAAGCETSAQSVLNGEKNLPVHMLGTKRVALARGLSRFRVGNHGLEVVKGAWTGTPRAERLCKCCGTAVEDEAHVVFECPVYEELRLKYHMLFEVTCAAENIDEKMRAFFGTGKITLLARFVADCCKARARMQTAGRPAGGTNDAAHHD